MGVWKLQENARGRVRVAWALTTGGEDGCLEGGRGSGAARCKSAPVKRRWNARVIHRPNTQNTERDVSEIQRNNITFRENLTGKGLCEGPLFH